MRTEPNGAPSFIQPNMLLVAGDWNQQPTFKLIPLTQDCPYVEVVFDPQHRILAVVNKLVKRKLQLVARLDENGDAMQRSGRVKEGVDPTRAQRIEVDAFHEYYLETMDDIKAFVEMFAVNPEHGAYQQFLPKVTPLQGPVVEGVEPVYATELQANPRMQIVRDDELALTEDDAVTQPTDQAA